MLDAGVESSADTLDTGLPDWKCAMARQVDKLTARRVQAIHEPGRHSDGGGLYLVIDKGGSKRWAFIYRRKHELQSFFRQLMQSNSQMGFEKVSVCG